MKHTYHLACSALLFTSLASAPAFAQQNGGTGVNYETRLSTLEDNMRVLNGRVEQAEFAVKKLDQAVQRLQADMDARLTKLETAPPPAVPPPSPQPQTPPPAANNIASPDVVVNGSLGAVKTQDGKVTGGVVNPKAPPLPDTPADYGLTPAEQYERAFSLLRQANYDEAEKAFKVFIDKNPKDKLVDNAKYWYGETLYVRGQFDASAAAFADAFQQNPKGTKAADSLLKLAMSLGALNKPEEACTALAELKSKYPSAPVTVRSRADEEQAKLKCGGH